MRGLRAASLELVVLGTISLVAASISPSVPTVALYAAWADGRSFYYPPHCSSTNWALGCAGHKKRN